MRGVDRISSLPDPILHHILSTLETVQVVRTCVLSTRWRDLWASVPHLRFDFSNLKIEINDVHGFINKVMLLRDGSDLQTFHLFGSHHSQDYDHLYVWLRYAARHNVQHLQLYSGRYTETGGHHYLLICTSLTTLTLIQSVIDFKARNHVRLSSLRTVYLGCVWFKGGSFEKLISGCPLLHCLTISGACNFEDEPVMDISSLSLQILNLFLSDSEIFSVAKIKICAPALVHLEIGLHYLSGVELSLTKMASLATSYIDIGREGYCSAPGIAQGLYSVHTLRFGSNILQHIFRGIVCLSLAKQQGGMIIPTFQNLKELELDAGAVDQITWLLRFTPKLEKLVIKKLIKVTTGPSIIHENREPTANNSPYDLLKSLKVVEIRGRKRPHDLCELLKFLISNAKLFEKMIIS